MRGQRTVNKYFFTDHEYSVPTIIDKVLGDVDTF